MRLTQDYTGRSFYQSEQKADGHSLVVAIECHIGEFPDSVHALLDTGSYWCVLPPAIAEELEYGAEPADAYYLTRFGRLERRLHRIPLIFPAHDGIMLQIEATWFVSNQWPGPAVIGRVPAKRVRRLGASSVRP